MQDPFDEARIRLGDGEAILDALLRLEERIEDIESALRAIGDRDRQRARNILEGGS